VTTSSPAAGDGPATGTVTLVVGDTGRSRAAGANRAGRAPEASARSGAGPGPEEQAQWSWSWSVTGPGAGNQDGPAEPDLTLTLSPADAELVRQGALSPSVAFMQGRLKTSGDNALLLRVLAWAEGPDLAAALAGEP